MGHLAFMINMYCHMLIGFGVMLVGEEDWHIYCRTKVHGEIICRGQSNISKLFPVSAY